MLNINVKSQLLQVLNCMIELHTESLSMMNTESFFTILQDCQNAAIQVGETLESDAENALPIVRLLEEYCENVYIIAQEMSITNEKVSQLNIFVKEVIDFVESQKCKYRVVFFPYKASMWDSLESIWAACSKDEKCECQVVTIPYYKFDLQKGLAQFCYEATEFPRYVPIRNYLNYDIKKEKPDIAYVHNPYDDCNYVTSVHPDYYSKKLKQYVKRLVYVPYYVTSGYVSEHHKFLPIYTQMDYMIAQSKNFKDGFKGLPYYSKILALGSPKFDRIIHNISKPGIIPDMWTSRIEGKKVVMLNTSINCFLSSGDLMLRKLKKVFQIFEKRNNIVLIWRPHPLIEATIVSMRPELKPSYDDLINYFTQQQVGILDHTADITNTVSISDAYIGENSSSVVNLFEVAGKPVFILDNFITDYFSEEERRTIIIADIASDGKNSWILPLNYNGLFKVEGKDWRNVTFIKRFSHQSKWACTYIAALLKEEKLYLSPYDATEAVSIDINTHEVEILHQKNNTYITSWNVIEYQDCLFFILNYHDAIVQYNLITKKWTKFIGVFKELTAIRGKEKIPNMWSHAVYKEMLWITAIYSNKIIEFNMSNGKMNILSVGAEKETFSAISCDDIYLYIAESSTGNIIYINRINGDKKTYKMPNGFFLQNQNQGTSVAHLKLINTQDFIITIPYSGNSMVKINKRTGKSIFLAKDFWNSSVNMHNGYAPYTHGKAFFAKQISQDHVLVQRLYDGALAEIDINTNQYTICYPLISKESFQKFTMHQDGFEKSGEGNNFSCKESKIFSLDVFLDKLVNREIDDIHKRQAETLSSMAANLDGTCGEKVHKYLTEEIEAEYSKL